MAECFDKDKEKESVRLCFCGDESAVLHSWTERNPGRRFRGCPNYKGNKGCKFFDWVDTEPVSGWARLRLFELKRDLGAKEEQVETLAHELKQLEDENRFLRSLTGRISLTGTSSVGETLEKRMVELERKMHVCGIVMSKDKK